MSYQPDFFDECIEQKFERWKATDGGRHLLRIAYRMTVPYAARYHATGRRVSMKLIWELVRDQTEAIRQRLSRRGIEVKKFDGFSLNNIFTAHVARHILAHRKDWCGLFELRETNVPRPRKKIVVITTDLSDRHRRSQ